MKKLTVLTLLLVSVSLVGCAGGPRKKMQDDHRKSIKTVAIDAEVSIPKRIAFDNGGAKLASNFGLIGLMISDSKKKNGKRELGNALESGNVSVPALIYSAFSYEMAKHTPFKPLKAGSKADATLTMKVHSYGFDTLALGSTYYPSLTVSAVIKNARGKAIWRNRGVVTSITEGNKTGYTYEQMMANPTRMKKMLAKAATLAAKKAMADL